MSNPWPGYARLPAGAAAALSALHLREPRLDDLRGINDPQWRGALDFTDCSQLTLALRNAAYEAMPQWVRERTDQNAADNRLRLRNLEELYRNLAAQFERGDIKFLALKGLTHCPQFGWQAEDRTQCDIDLFTPQEQIEAARDAVIALGFESMEGMEAFPTDHIPSLIRKTGWQWTGNHFDPEIPHAVELHFQFWNDDLERLPVPDTGEFWKRRTVRRIAGIEMPVLGAADSLAYASLHLLRHLLRGSARPFHVLEIARFLEQHASQSEFWEEWSAVHSPELRRLQAVIFRLAAEWFGCRTGPVAEEEMRRLPAATRNWFERFALSAASGRFHANKDELWLHLSLLTSQRDAWDVARRRLFPARLPGPVDAVHIPDSQMRWTRRVLKHTRYAAYVASRVWHHAAALPSFAISGVRSRR